jgi:hypothetical protein
MSHNTGFSTRLAYDNCAYNKRVRESTSTFAYQTYDGKFENDRKCYYSHFTRPYDQNIIDIESELRNITRPASKCVSKKYNPKCETSSRCISTFSKDVPVVLAPEICPIVSNNLNWTGGTGIRDPKPCRCAGFDMSK